MKLHALVLTLVAASSSLNTRAAEADSISSVVQRVAGHSFHPIRGGFTFDRQLDKHGVADLNDPDWRVRTLAVRDLVRAGLSSEGALVAVLSHSNAHVRHVAAMTLGILRATNAVAALETALAKDTDDFVRSQTAVALWQIGRASSLDALRASLKEDKSRDVRHQAELAIHALERGHAATPELAAAYRALDESRFNRAKVGEPAPDFQLPDTDGRVWKLSDFRGKKPVVLIWIFADWCPVCHGEFRELIELRRQFETAGVQVFTLEAHDVYPARVMVGKELEPEYWFSKTSFMESYTKNIWWPHLVDRAGAVGAEYGVQPMAFVVHAEWINRPSVVIVDRDGLVRIAYYGTFWGDRPSIKQALTMVQGGNYFFDAPKRLKPAAHAAHP